VSAVSKVLAQVAPTEGWDTSDSNGFELGDISFLLPSLSVRWRLGKAIEDKYKEVNKAHSRLEANMAFDGGRLVEITGSILLFLLVLG